MKGSRFNPPRSRFGNVCTIKDCKEEVVLCNLVLEDGLPCNCYGHRDYYKYDEEHIVPVIEHAHFMPNKDIGRNVIHNAGKPIHAPESLRVYTWRTIRGEKRFSKIPLSVRKALGWVQ